MSNIHCIDFYDLCRICTASSGQRINIFSPEGRIKNLSLKISESLGITIDEKDRLPKMICSQCLQHVEKIYEFRNVSKNAQDTLNSWLNKATLQNGEKVLMKDANGSPGKSLSVLSGNAQLPLITSNTLQNPIQNNNLLSTIMQAVSSMQQQSGFNQQYTITVDNKPMQNNAPVEYKIESSSSSSAPTIDEFNMKADNNEPFEDFIKLKPDIKITPIGKKTVPKSRPLPQHQQQNQQLQQQQHQQQQQQQHQQQQQQQLQQQTTFQQIQQQLQQQLQQEWQQQQLKQHIQQLTSQLQAQSQITISAPPGLAAVSSTQPNSTTISQTEEGLSPSKKTKLNFVLSSPTQQTFAATPQPQIQLQLQPTTSAQPPPPTTQALNAATILSKLATPQASTSNVLSPNKCFLPITIRDENSDQQIVAHIDAKNFMLPTTYQVQMKFLPQLATADGQPIMELTPTSIPATLQLTPQALTNSTFQAAALNTTATPIQTHIQQLLLDPTHQQQQQRQTTARVTSQQIIRSPNQSLTVGNRAQVNSNINNTVQITTNNPAAGDNDRFRTPPLVKSSDKFKMTQQNNIIDIKPTTHLTQQIMEQVKHQIQVKQQEQNASSAAARPSIMPPLQHTGLTVQRLPAKSLLAAQSTKTLQQPAATTTMTSIRTLTNDAVSNATSQQQIPILNKQNITISRITTQNIQQPQQNVQRQATTTTTKLSPPQQKKPKPMQATTQIQKHQLTTTQQVPSVLNKVLTKKIVQKPMPKLVATNSIQSAGPAIIATSGVNTLPSSLPSKPTNNITSSTRIVPSTPVTNQVSGGATNNDNTESTPSSQHTCPTCNRGFKKKEHLTQHVKLHAGLRPFKCTEVNCNKAFSRKEHLLRHLVSHTGKKMFSCDVCQKPFSRKDNLNKHKRVHSSQPTESPYQCEICNKKFEMKSYFEEHKAKHNKPNINKSAPVSAAKQNDKTMKTTQTQTKTKPISGMPQTVATKSPQQQQQQQSLTLSSSNNQQPAQQKQQQQQVVHVQMQQPHVVTTQDLAGNTITITQAAPTSLANFVQLGFSQYQNATSGQIVCKIDNK